MNRVLTFVALALLGTACGETARTPSAPSRPLTAAGAAPSPSTPNSAVTGVVYEVTAAGRRPLGGVGIDMSAGYQSWPPQVTTDGDGRYTFPTVLPSLALSGQKLIAEKAGYSQPCRVQVVPGIRDHDIHLVSNVTLATAGMPASFPIVPPVLNGAVFEQTPAGRQPIAGASIILDFTGGMGWAPSARTTTDPRGRYVLCNVEVGTGFGLSALVAKEGYASAFVDATVRPPNSFDIELKRLN